MSNAILKILRQRRGLAADDTSNDSDLLKYRDLDLFRELVAWELGEEAWADWMIRTVERAGGKVVWGDK